jgi:hypothetical protein
VSGHDLEWPIAEGTPIPAIPSGSRFILLPETLEAESWIETTCPIAERKDIRASDGSLLFRSLIVGSEN